MITEQLKQLEDNLWSAADNLRANSDLKASKYSTPVLGLIFLKFADLDEIKEQDYSLNPGRYVGVVIEEDGKTEEEFIAETILMNDQLNELFNSAENLHKTIAANLSAIAGDDQ